MLAFLLRVVRVVPGPILFVVFALAAAPAQAQTGSITGVVAAAGGAPIEGVQVSAYSQATGGNGSAITQADGSYTMSGLPAGSYFVYTINALGYVDKSYDNLPRYGEGFTPVAVSANATTSNINFTLAVGGSISGTVTDASAAPLAGINVSVWTASGLYAGSGASAAADGTYLVSGLPAGTYVARTDNNAGYIDKVFNDIVCVTCDVTHGTPITVVVGATTPGVNFALALGGRLAGTITDSNGAPISGVSVSVYDASGVYMGVRSPQTDAAGHYVTTGLIAGTYFARTFNYSGYVDEVFNNIPCMPCQPTSGTPISVTLGTESTIDFSLETGGIITGLVTATGGAPLAGVGVSAYDLSGNLVGSTTTAADGTYSVSGLPTGSVHLRTFNAIGYVDELYNDLVCLSCSLAAGQAVAVTPGSTTGGINFTLDLGGRFAGHVSQLGSGQPLAGVTVQVFSAAGVAVASSTTDVTGNYAVIGLPAAGYFLRTFNSSNYVDQVYDGISCASSCTVTSGTLLGVTSGNLTTANFVLTQAGSISGTVTDSTGTPLAGIGVKLFTTAGAPVPGNGTTDADGHYTIGSLSGGGYRAFTFNSLGYVNKVFDNITCTADCSTMAGTPIAVSLGATTGGVNFALAVGGQVSGTVTGAGGAPLSNARVTVYNSAGVFFATTFTNASGGYTASDVPTGTYFVVGSASNVGYVDKLYNNITCGSGCTVTTGTPVSVTNGSTTTGVNFALALGGSVAGTITGAGGAPIAGVSVPVYNSSGVQISGATTNASGAYTVAGLPAGTVFLRTFASSTGYLDKRYNDLACTTSSCVVTGGTPVAVSAGATTSGINFALVQGASVSGTVTDTGGSPISGVTVQVSNSTGTIVGAGLTNASGIYTATQLPAGTSFLRTVNSLGFLDQLYNGIGCLPSCAVTSGTPVAVGTGSTVTGVNFVLTAGGRISGTVTSAISGAGLAGVNIQIVDAAGAHINSVQTSSTGAFISTQGLTAGNYFVQTSNSLGFVDQVYNGISCPPSCNPLTGTAVVVSVGATATANFALSPGGRIGGVISNAVGGAQIAATAQVFNASGTLVATATGSGGTPGTYVSAALQPGTYFVRTSNTLGFLDQLYSGLPCLSCSATTGTPIVLTAGSTATINFALSPGARISTTVTNSVTSAAISGVSVQVFNSAGTQVTSGNTNASGVFLNTLGLPTGNYFVRTSNSLGFIDELYNNLSCVPSCTVTTGTPVAATAGSTTPIAIALAPGGRISGTVTGPTGTGVGSATVDALNSAGAIVKSATTTAGTGAYTITGLPTGSYFVRTRNSGFLDEAYNDIPCFNCAAASVGAAPVSVTENVTTSNINFQLADGGRIAGTVTDATTGLPISGISVTATGLSLSGAASATTSAAGTFVIAGLPTGTYNVRTAPANTTVYIAEIYNNVHCFGCASSPNATPVAVTASAQTSGIDFSLEHGGRFSGTVTDQATGLPISGITINVIAFDGTAAGSATTNAAGVYTTTAVDPGIYFLKASSGSTAAAQGYIAQAYSNVPCVGCAINIATAVASAVTADQTFSGLDFALSQGSRISGTISDAGTAAPIPNIAVSIYAANGILVSSSAVSDAAGHYLIRDGLTPGSYFARTNTGLYLNKLYNDLPCAPTCTATGGTPITVVSGNDTGGIDFSLVAGGRIGGTVTDAVTGLPLGSITVGVYDASGTLVRSAITNTAGIYTTGALLAGDYHVLARGTSTNYIRQSYGGAACVGCDPATAGSPVTVSLGATTTGVDFALTAGGRVAGTVTNSGGTPLGGVLVELFVSPYDRAATQATTDVLGHFTTEFGLPAGTYRARTSNTLGYINQMWDHVSCGTACDLSTGADVTIVGTATTTGINFSLTVDADADGDGIINTIDKNAVTLADESAIVSAGFSDVPQGGTTDGSISDSGGGTTSITDLSPGGVKALLSAAGPTPTILSVCQLGASEEVVLNASGEAASIVCAPVTGSTTVKALATLSTIELRKTVGGITTVVEIPQNQSATLGSPAEAADDNTTSLHVRILNALGVEIGNYTLDPGESAEAIVTPGGTVIIEAFSGAVTATVGNETKTVGEGQTETFSSDTTPPVLTVPANFIVHAHGSGGAFVTFTVTATDAVDGPVSSICSRVSGSTFAVGLTTVNCSATDSHHNTANASFAVTVIDVSQTIVFAALADATYGGPDFPLVATGGASGQPVTFSSSGNCLVAGAMAHITGAGSCTVTAHQAGDATYDAAADVSRAFNIAKAPQTIVVSTHAPASALFGSSFTVAASGGASGQPVAYSSGGGCSNTGSQFTMTSGVANCVVHYNQAGSSNYLAAAEVVETTMTTGFAFQGFFAPIEMSTLSANVWNSANAGQAIPTKWRVTLSGTPVSSLSSFGNLYSFEVSCSTGAGDITTAIEEYAPGDSTVTYKGDGNFQFDWKTPKSYAGTCRKMYVQLSDGGISTLANFKFK